MMQQSKRRGRTFGIATFALVAWGVATLWSWNTFAVELLGLPEMAYRHALALCILLLTGGMLLAAPLWAFRAGST